MNCSSREIHCYGYGIKPEWMNGMGSWKEVMESKEAKAIREGAEGTFKSRRRNQSLKKKKDGNKLIIHEAHGTHQETFRTTGAATMSFKNAEMESTQVMRPSSVLPLTFTEGQSHASSVASIRQHHLPRSAAVSSMSCAWLNSSLPLTHLTPRSDMRLLMTFLDVIFPLQYGFYGLSGNTDRRWLLEILIDTEPLYQASLSVSASFESTMRRGIQNGTSDLDADARTLQIEALKGLQHRVDELGTETHGGKAFLRRGMETLAIMAQLVSFEVFSFVEGQWEMHLQAARTILGLLQNKWTPELFTEKGVSSDDSNNGEAPINQYSTEDLEALRFFITSFVWVDIVANATHGPPPSNPGHFDYLPLLRNGFLKPQEMMGCHSCIMISIVEVTTIEAWKNAQIEQGCLSVVELVTRAAPLNDNLTFGIQKLECNLCINSTSLRADSEAVNLIFAYAALIYLHTVVSGASPHIVEIKDNVTRCLERLEALPPRLFLRNCWPFTIAGCMANEHQHDRFRNLVTRTSAAGQALGTTWKGLKVMEECWRLRKCEPGLWCWKSTMKHMNVKILLV
jgi:C6 transcription factor Pro1